MPDAEPSYVWTDNPACTATWKVLKQSDLLDQFEDADISFADAATVKLKDLIYFPKTSINPRILEVLSLEIARKFATGISSLYAVTRENTDESSADIISAIAAVFADGEKTVTDLAGVVDAGLKFPDQA